LISESCQPGITAKTKKKQNKKLERKYQQKNLRRQRYQDKTQVKGKGKGKVHPRTSHEAPEGEWRYSYTFSLT
jgi:hypothetical protein